MKTLNVFPRISFILSVMLVWLPCVQAQSFEQPITFDDFDLMPHADNSGLMSIQQLSSLSPRTLAELIATSRGQVVRQIRKSIQSAPSPSHFRPPSGGIAQGSRIGHGLVTTKGELGKISENEQEEEVASLSEARILSDGLIFAQKKIVSEHKGTRNAGGRLEPRYLSKQPLNLETRQVDTRNENRSLLVKIRKGRLEVYPSRLHFVTTDEPLNVFFDHSARGAQIFLRDRKLVHWDFRKKLLFAKKVGKSELFVTLDTQMLIVPVEVSKLASIKDPIINEENSLQALTSILPMKENPYTYMSSEQGGVYKNPSLDLPEDIDGEAPQKNKPLTIADTAAEVDAVKKMSEQHQSRFVYPDFGTNYRKVAIQVIEERSAPEQSLVYPATGVNVRLLGTPVAARTDARGHAFFGDVPAGSRFWVLIEDDKGQFVPTITEMSLDYLEKAEVLRARTLSYRSYFAYQSVLDLVQDNNLSSFCGRVMSADGQKNMPDIQVSLNAKAKGPFYFGSFGPQRDLNATDINGRFCFFNIQPGLAEFSFHDGGGYRTSISLPLFPGAHTEEDILLENLPGRSFYLASIPSASEQVYDDGSNTEPFQRVDTAEIISIGGNEALSLVSPGVVAQESITSFKGRSYKLAQSPEFENVVYGIDQSKKIGEHMTVLPLFSRGFVEDLYHELNQQEGHDTIPFDPALGHALVFHKLTNGGPSSLKIRLVDNSGHMMEEAWYFGNTDGLLKSAFFNLRPGVYQVIVESSQGALIALDTLVVDYWTTAFVQTASTLQYDVGSRAREAASEDN